MRPTQPARKLIKGRPTEGLKRSHSRWLHNRQCADDIEIVRTTNHWEIWICQRGEPRRCAGSVGLTLASDALRQGQDLVEDLLNDTLKQLERSHNFTGCASAQRRDGRHPRSGTISATSEGRYSVGTPPLMVGKYQRCLA